MFYNFYFFEKMFVFFKNVITFSKQMLTLLKIYFPCFWKTGWKNEKNLGATVAEPLQCHLFATIPARSASEPA